jgi:phosphoribosylformylglycinamidine cyclo-ligase
MTVRAALLAPTRTYAPIMQAVLRKYRTSISAIFHNTGGGQTKCLKFGRNVRYVKDNLFPLPPVFELMRRNTSLSLREMARLFNLGHRMEIVCDAGAAEGIMEISQSMGVDARVVGRVEEGGEKPTLRLTLEGEVIEFQ